MRALALQSGTSVDGIDIAIVDIDPLDDSANPMVSMTPISTTVREWPAELRSSVLDAAHGAALTVGTVCRLDTLLGQEFASAAQEAIRAGESPVDLVVSPGQTVFHWGEGGHARGTLQLGDPAWIAEATGSPVLSDLRSTDIAAGGEGAPLMAVFDRAWLGRMAEDSGRSIATLNLGGIANLTFLAPDGGVTAWDTGPGNGLIDAFVSRETGGALSRDEDGRLARRGAVDADLLAELLRHPYFSVAQPKSTGRETFDLTVVDAALAATGGKARSLETVVATLTALTARTVADALATTVGRMPERVLASGGGVHNPALMGALADELSARGARIESSSVLGVDPDAKESLLFALIGFLSWNGIPCRLPATPPGRERVLGSVTPPRAPAVSRTLSGIRGLVVRDAASTNGGGR